MGSEWTTIREVSQAFDGPHATPTKTDEGPVFLGITSLENGRLDLSISACLSEKDFVKWTKRVTPQEGDVVFSYETKLGEAALITPGLRCCLGRRMGLLRPKKNKIISEYLLYSFLSPVFQQQISENTNYGITVNRIALKVFPDFSLRVPSLDEQRFVVSVLKTLDDKIELNRKMNETLEAMAQALFKSWFVDFDPVIDNALKAGKPIPEALAQKAAARKALGRDRPSLPEEIQGLFPSEFVRSEEMGWIPGGWRAAPLGEWVDAHSGGTPSKTNAVYWNGDIPWISPKVMTSIHADWAEHYVTEAAIGNGTRIAPAGSTLVMVRGMGLHQEVRVSQALRDVAFNQDVKALVGTHIDETLLLYSLLDAKEVLLGRVESAGHGTGKLPSHA